MCNSKDLGKASRKIKEIIDLVESVENRDIFLDGDFWVCAECGSLSGSICEIEHVPNCALERHSIEYKNIKEEYV